MELIHEWLVIYGNGYLGNFGYGIMSLALMMVVGFLLFAFGKGMKRVNFYIGIGFVVVCGVCLGVQVWETIEKERELKTI